MIVTEPIVGPEPSFHIERREGVTPGRLGNRHERRRDAAICPLIPAERIADPAKFGTRRQYWDLVKKVREAFRHRWHEARRRPTWGACSW